jgi:hypothetical protein
MFPLDAPPDTSAYMIAGYAVFFIVAAIYIVSLVVRWRNIHQDMTTLEAIEKENKLKKEKAPKTEKQKAVKKK